MSDEKTTRQSRSVLLDKERSSDKELLEQSPDLNSIDSAMATETDTSAKKTDHFKTLLDDDPIESSKDDLLLFSEEVTEEPIDELTFDELVATASIPDNSTALPIDDSVEPSEDDPLLFSEEVTEEPIDTLIFDEPDFDKLLDTDSIADSAITPIDDNTPGENGLEPIPDTDLGTPENSSNHVASATENGIIAHGEVRSVPVEKIADKAASFDGTSAAFSSTPDFPMSGAEDRQQTKKRPRKIFIALAIVVLSGTVAGLWYGYYNIGNEPKPLQQGKNDQQNQLDQDNINRHAEQGPVQTKQSEAATQEVEEPVKSLRNERKDFGKQTKKKLSKLFNASRATRQLERRLASIEKELVDYGGKDQAKQIVVLKQQVRFLEQLVRKSGKTKQGVSGDITLQLNRLDTNIKRLENYVSQIRLQKNSGNNAISSVKREPGAMTTEGTVIQSNATINKPSTPEVIAEPKGKSGRDGTLPVNTHKVQGTSFRTAKIISVPETSPKKTSWAVNLGSYTKRALAEKEHKRLRSLGIDTIVQKTKVRKITWYRVRIDGFSSAETARRYIKSQVKQNKIKDAWVSTSQF